MNAARQRPNDTTTDKADSGLAARSNWWINGRRGHDARQERRVQHAGVGTNGRPDEASRDPDRRINHPRISSASIGKTMRRKIISWINDPNVLLPVLAFCVVMMTTLMAKAGIL